MRRNKRFMALAIVALFLGIAASAFGLSAKSEAALLTSTTSVSVAYDHSCAISSAGALFCWGDNQYGQLGNGTNISSTGPTPVTGLASGVIQVVASSGFTCAVLVNHQGLCWGINNRGQLGNGTTTLSLTPTPIANIGNQIAQIDASQATTCAVTTQGAAYCWGGNEDGQVGNATFSSAELTPQQVSGLTANVLSIDVYGPTSCALRTTGYVQCWGINDSGQLGILARYGSNVRTVTPVYVADLQLTRPVAQIKDLCALQPDNQVKCWGYSASDGPSSITNWSDVRTIVSRDCAIKLDGSLWCRGDNSYGQLGIGITADTSTDPVHVDGLSGSLLGAASASENRNGRNSTVCAIDLSGQLSCWGYNYWGQLGNNTRQTSIVPRSVATRAHTGVSGFTQSPRCADTTAGDAYCWGSNYFGRLGISSTIDTNTPTKITGLNGHVSDVSSGANHTCALWTSGEISCWGYNYWGQLGNANRENVNYASSAQGTDYIAVSAGYEHTCALRVHGQVLCWGINAYGNLGNGGSGYFSTTPVSVGLNGPALQISVGSSSSCAVLRSSQLQCWGYNGDGKLGDGTKTNRIIPVQVSGMATGVKQVAVGAITTCAVMQSGEVKCWGNNQYGQIGDGTTSERLTPVSVVGLSGFATQVSDPSDHTCALLESGQVECWGAQSNGNLGTGKQSDQLALSPFRVQSLGSDIRAISGSCASTFTGGLKCWGSNTYGQLGDGTNTDSLVPVNVAQISSTSSTSQNFQIFSQGNSPLLTGPRALANSRIALTVSPSAANAGDPIEIQISSPSTAGLRVPNPLASQTSANQHELDAVISIGSNQYTLRGSLNGGVVAAGTPDNPSASPTLFASGWTISSTPGNSSSVDGNGVTGSTGIGATLRGAEATPVSLVAPAKSGNYGIGLIALIDNQILLPSPTSVGLTDPNDQIYNTDDTNAGGVAGTVGPGGPTGSFALNQGNGLTTGGGNFIFTSPISLTVTGGSAASVPAAPTGVTGVAGNQTVAVSWNPADDGGSRINNYTVTSTPGDKTCSTNGALTCTVAGLTNGTSYTFAVTATNEFGTSLTSSPSALILVPTSPSAPLNVVGIGLDSKATVSWDAPASNGGSSITSYQVTVPGFPSKGCTTTVNSTTGALPTTCEVGSLSNGTTYVFEVKAINVAGASDASAPSNFTLVARPPDAPQNVQATGGDGQVSLTWNAPGNNGQTEITSYVARAIPGGASCTVNPDPAQGRPLTFCQITGLANGQPYRFTVVARNVKGSSPPSPPSSPFTPATAPRAVTGIQATSNTSQSAVVSWDAIPGQATQLAGGYESTCARKSDSSVLCWGNNIYGQLGPLGGGLSSTPVVARPADVSQISGGIYLGPCTIIPEGNVQCWGQQSSLRTIAGVTGAVDIATGAEFGCAILSDGTVKCWGANNLGQLGDGSTTSRDDAQLVPGISGALQITANQQNTCVLNSDLTVKCWGGNVYGQLGNGTINGIANPNPVQVQGLTEVLSIASGTYGQCALRSGGEIKCWGAGGGSLPTLRASIPGATQIAGNDGFVCARKLNGEIQCIGSNGNGELGRGVFSFQSLETSNVQGIENAVDLIAGHALYSNHVCALISDGSVNCWGANSAGQLGIGVVGASSPLPVSVSGFARGDGGNPVTSYTVSAVQDPSKTCTASAAATSCTVSGLTNGASYTFKVTASNSVGPSTPSEASSSVIPNTTPDAPTNVSASAGNTYATVSWTSSPVVSAGVNTYTATSSPGGLTCTTTKTGCLISGLDNGTAYTFTVKASNSAGDSDNSGASNEVTPVSSNGQAPFNVFAQVNRLSPATPPLAVGASLLSMTFSPASASAGAPIEIKVSSPSVGGLAIRNYAPVVLSPGLTEVDAVISFNGVDYTLRGSKNLANVAAQTGTIFDSGWEVSSVAGQSSSVDGNGNAGTTGIGATVRGSEEATTTITAPAYRGKYRVGLKAIVLNLVQDSFTSALTDQFDTIFNTDSTANDTGFGIIGPGGTFGSFATNDGNGLNTGQGNFVFSPQVALTVTAAPGAPSPSASVTSVGGQISGVTGYVRGLTSISIANYASGTQPGVVNMTGVNWDANLTSGDFTVEFCDTNGENCDPSNTDSRTKALQTDTNGNLSGYVLAVGGRTCSGIPIQSSYCPLTTGLRKIKLSSSNDNVLVPMNVLGTSTITISPTSGGVGTVVTYSVSEFVPLNRAVAFAGVPAVGAPRLFSKPDGTTAGCGNASFGNFNSLGCIIVGPSTSGTNPISNITISSTGTATGQVTIVDPATTAIVVEGRTIANGVANTATDLRGLTPTNGYISSVFTVLFPPKAPSIDSVTLNGSDATVQFQQPTSSSDIEVTNYDYSTNNGSTWTAFSPAVVSSPAVIGGLSSGSDYVIKLRGINSVGRGAASAGVALNATPVGANVEVPFVAGSDAGSITFDNVVSSGTTSATPVTTTSPTYVAPANFSLGDPPTYFDIATTAQFSGSVEICLPYDPMAFAFGAKPRLFHFTNNQWADITTSVNTLTGQICGDATSLSPFALGSPVLADQCIAYEGDQSGGAGCDTSQQVSVSVEQGVLTQRTYVNTTVAQGSSDGGSITSPIAGTTNVNTDATTINLGSIVSPRAPTDITGQLNDITVSDNRGGVYGWSLTADLTSFASSDGTQISPAKASAAPVCEAATNATAWAYNDANKATIAGFDSTLIASGQSAGSVQNFGTAVNLCTKDPTVNPTTQTTGGVYNVGAPLTLNLPAFQKAGRYVAVLTITLA